MLGWSAVIPPNPWGMSQLLKYRLNRSSGSLLTTSKVCRGPILANLEGRLLRIESPHHALPVRADAWHLEACCHRPKIPAQLGQYWPSSPHKSSEGLPLKRCARPHPPAPSRVRRAC